MLLLPKELTHKGIGRKILTSFLGLALVTLAVFGYVAFDSMNEISKHSEESTLELGQSATDDSVAALEKLGGELIELVAVDVARQLEVFIRENPNMTVEELQEDEYFSSLAVQPVGLFGYTAIADVSTLVCRFHASEGFVDMDLHLLEESRPGFWEVMSRTEGGHPSQGHYNWTEEDGSLRQKYMYIAIVNATTADNVTFSVAATTYTNEFSQPAEDIRARIGWDTDESTREIDEEIAQTRLYFFFILVLMIVLVSGSAIFLSRDITTPITELRESAATLGRGDLDHRVSVKTGDELEELGETFNRMATDLKQHIDEVARTTREKERIERELQIAHNIQKSFLPLRAPEIPGYHMAGLNLPAREVGGDFYDFIEFEEDKLGIVVADVSGKGVPAALFMGISKTLLRANAKRILDPVLALQEVNSIILEESDSGMFVTLFYAILDFKENTLTYVNAGHNPPILMKQGEHEFTLLKAEGVPVGVLEEMKLESRVVQLEQNETVFLYTDGVTEAVNSKEEEFGTERLDAILGQHGKSSPEALIEHVVREIKEFAGEGEQFDDITMVVLKSSSSQPGSLDSEVVDE